MPTRLLELAHPALGLQIEPLTVLNEIRQAKAGSAARHRCADLAARHARARLWPSPHQRAEEEKAGLRPRPVRIRKPASPWVR